MKLLEALTRKDFNDCGDTVLTPHGPNVFIDRGASVLGVAHTDYVMFQQPRQEGHKIYCPQLDDRLGVYVMMELLPRMGVNVDVLLTDSEESGNSTGQFFHPPKQYNWIFSFDRMGTDVVMYQYETKELEDCLEDFGFEVGVGSFSDISFMEHLEVQGMNFGVGYYHQHTSKCFADTTELASNLRKFRRFYRKYHDFHLPFVPVYYGDEAVYWESDKYDGYDDYCYDEKDQPSSYDEWCRRYEEDLDREYYNFFGREYRP